MIYNTLEGTTFTATAEFLDDNDSPLQPKPGYPKVRLYDVDSDIVFEATAAFVSLGNYQLEITLPNFGYESTQQLRLVWVFRDSSNNKYKNTDVVIVEPNSLKRDTDLFTISGVDTKADFVIPESVSSNDLTVSLFDRNVFVTNLSVNVSSNGVDRTQVDFTLPQLSTKLENFLVICKVARSGARIPKNYSYKLWHVTPSVVNQISLIEDFVNKSRIENTIVELEYTHADIMSALKNGLAHFNSLSPQLTSFNGLNMQGSIGNAWFICSCWYLIHAQRLAEGNVAFDYSGQGVSLNVDRTAHLDTLLGALDTRIQDAVVPLKKLLVKAGIVSGDGSQGDNLNGNVDSRAAAKRMGVLTVVNSPTTRFVRGARWRTG